jgi:NTP pyrophosphatase (non-canonical NTP hydrolase)
MKPLTQKAKEIHADNRVKGFYDKVTFVLDSLKSAAMKDKNQSMYVAHSFVWNSFIVQQMALIMTEMSEAIEKLRKDGIDIDLEPHSIDNELTYEENNKIFEMKYKDTVQDELADTLIRLLDLVGFLDIDIDGWVEAKLRYNKSRPHKHGKRF